MKLKNYSFPKFIHPTPVVKGGVNPSQLFNIDNSIKKMLNNIPGKPASIQKQNQWKSFSPNMKNIMRSKFKDTDGDRIPNRWDCQPRNIMRQDFSQTGSTGIPMFDNPDDYLVKKEVVQMSPDKYMKEAYRSHYPNPTYERVRYPKRNIPTFDEYKENTVDEKHMEKLKTKLADPNIKMDIPFLEYKEGELREQEGRHRATAAKKLGYKTIPVAIVESDKNYVFEQELNKLIKYYEENPRCKNQGACANAAQAIAKLFIKYRQSSPYGMEVYKIKTTGPDGLDSNHIVLKVGNTYFDPTGTQYMHLHNGNHKSITKTLPSYYKVTSTSNANYLIN